MPSSTRSAVPPTIPSSQLQGVGCGTAPSLNLLHAARQVVASVWDVLLYVSPCTCPSGHSLFFNVSLHGGELLLVSGSLNPTLRMAVLLLKY